MVKLVSGNFARREEAWRLLADADADVALLQEAVPPPGHVAGRLNVDAAPCDPATTLRHYVRLSTSARAKAVAGLDQVTRAAIGRGGEAPRRHSASLRQRRRARQPPQPVLRWPSSIRPDCRFGLRRRRFPAGLATSWRLWYSWRAAGVGKPLQMAIMPS